MMCKELDIEFAGQVTCVGFRFVVLNSYQVLFSLTCYWRQCWSPSSDCWEWKKWTDAIAFPFFLSKLLLLNPLGGESMAWPLRINSIRPVHPRMVRPAIDLKLQWHISCNLSCSTVHGILLDMDTGSAFTRLQSEDCICPGSQRFPS